MVSTDFKQTLWKTADKLRAQMDAAEYPPDQQQDAVEMVLRQAEVISEDQVYA